MEEKKIIKIIEGLKSIIGETRIDVSGDTLIDVAIRIYNSEQIEDHKQGNKLSHFNTPNKQLKPVSSPATLRSNPATDKQKNYLKSLGIKFPSNITKQEARKLIDERVK